MMQDKTGSLLMEWRERLGLLDWRIKLKTNVQPDDMFYGHCDGCTEWTEASKAATIQILDERFYGDRIVPFDFERILVHELLHLKLCLLGESGNNVQDRLLHQIVDDLARALVDAKRCGTAYYADDLPDVCETCEAEVGISRRKPRKVYIPNLLLQNGTERCGDLGVYETLSDAVDFLERTFRHTAERSGNPALLPHEVCDYGEIVFKWDLRDGVKAVVREYDLDRTDREGEGNGG